MATLGSDVLVITESREPDLDGLSHDIAEAWRSFDHHYSMKRKGKAKKGEETNTTPWSCSSLKDARTQYKFNGFDLDATNRKVNEISARLQAEMAIDKENCHALHHVCLEVLEWGGVEGVSSRWLREQCNAKLLRAKIRDAVSLLKSGASSPNFNRFNGNDLVMNSGLTKVYAFLAPDDVVIYDGRIGAAMGLFARRLCKKSGLVEARFGCGRKTSAIPTILQFPWGDGQAAEGSRNPSSDPYWFPRLNPGSKNGDSVHANACWQASRVLNQALVSIREQEPEVVLRDLEMGLFMVGYHVSEAG